MDSLPSLQQVSATHLIQLLQQFGHNNDLHMCPVWLNNSGQNVIGFFPKITFEIYHSENQYQLIQQSRQTFLTQKNSYVQTVHENFDFNELTTFLEIYQQQQLQIQNDNSKVDDKDFYKNGFIGFVSYDLSASNLANSNDINTYYLSRNQPLLFLAHYDIYLTFDDNQWRLNATSEQAFEQLTTIENWLNQLVRQTEITQPIPLNLSPVWKNSDYQQAFEKVQDYLKAGDCYQINLTQCWQGSLANQQLVDYLPKLHQATNAPFAGYLVLYNYELLSCSPELFFTFSKNAQGENIIISKPIKGTRPRGQNKTDDLAYKNELANSEKDSAENVMIVDLLRNDLGKYAKTGSVKVPKLFDIESFSNVHHMVSTITAMLKNDVSPWTVLFESLPAGSITGTPKKRAVEIINELEAKPRGAYCGTMGYLNFDGTGQWNVLIRTLQSVKGDVSLWAGGGITIASDCDAEYQECFDKVGNLLGILSNNN